MKTHLRIALVSCIAVGLLTSVTNGGPIPAGLPEPILHYGFDSPANVGNDDSGNGHNLAIPGTYSVVPGPRGDALELDLYDPNGGGPNFGSVPLGPYTSTSGLTYPGAGGFTVAYWVKLQPADGPFHPQTIVGDYYQHVAHGEIFGLRVNYDTETINFTLRWAFASPLSLTTTYAEHSLTVGDWVHLAATYSPGGYNVNLYVNGALAETGNLPAPMRDSTTVPYCYVGGSWHSTTGGDFDEVLLFDRSLSQPEIAQLAVPCSEPATIIEHPVCQMVPLDDLCQFAVTLDDETDITYQWRKDGVPLADGEGIIGAQSSILTIEAKWHSVGWYDVVASGSCGLLVSKPALLAIPHSCPGDFNGDGVIDVFDFTLFAPRFGETCNAP